MAEDTTIDSKFQLYLGPIVGVLILLFALTHAYERAELVSYDWRFNIRNSLFGLPEMDPRLGTIEIDDQTLEVVNVWSYDWRDVTCDSAQFDRNFSPVPVQQHEGRLLLTPTRQFIQQRGSLVRNSGKLRVQPRKLHLK